MVGHSPVFQILLQIVMHPAPLSAHPFSAFTTIERSSALYSLQYICGLPSLFLS